MKISIENENNFQNVKKRVKRLEKIFKEFFGGTKETEKIFCEEK